MNLAALTNEGQHVPLALVARHDRPCRGRTRVHQRLHVPWHIAVIDEDVFLEVEPWVTAFQITRAVIVDPMTQHQILGACGRANRIGLHEAQSTNRFSEGRRGKQAPRDGKPAQVAELRHAIALTKTSSGSQPEYCPRCL